MNNKTVRRIRGHVRSIAATCEEILTAFDVEALDEHITDLRDQLDAIETLVNASNIAQTWPCLHGVPATDACIDCQRIAAEALTAHPVCPNCGQFQHPKAMGLGAHLDCINDCARRGLTAMNDATEHTTDCARRFSDAAECTCPAQFSARYQEGGK